jgi:hypothetical protein
VHVVRANKDRKPKVLNLKKKVKHMKTQAKGEYIGEGALRRHRQTEQF